MSVPQTSMSTAFVPGVEGQIAEGVPSEVITRVVETADGVGAGRAMRWGTNPATQALVFSADAHSAQILGVTVRLPFSREQSTPEFPLGAEVSLLRRGAIWLICPVAIAPSDFATLSWIVTGADAGRLTNVVDANDRAIGVRCLQGAGAGQLGLFYLNLGGT